MNFFVCLIRLSGEPVTEADRRPFTQRLVSRGLHGDVSWEVAGSLSAIVRRPGDVGPRLANLGSLIGVGDVQFDNPKGIATRLSEQLTSATHLDLALRAVQESGTASTKEFLGDFAYVTWDPSTLRLVAARDTFGVKSLFYSKMAPDLLAFSSHASLLGISGKISEEYIAKHFVRSVSEEDNPFASVNVVPAAHTLSVKDGRWYFDRYWSPDPFDIDPKCSGPEAVEEFRRRFEEAVRLRLAGPGPVWSELSGGLDTSAVVSMARWLNQSGKVDGGVSGTITYADSLGAGDESEFVDAVVQACGVSNEQIRDSWPWKDDGAGPMPTEMPGPITLFWSRTRQRDEILRNAGAQALLSGFGGDHLLEGNLHFFADWLAAGYLRRTCGEMAHWSALQQRSFWKFAFQHALVPLLPAAARSRFASREKHLQIPSWMAPSFRKRFSLDAHLRRTIVPPLSGGSLPRYRAGNIEHVRFLARGLPSPHPFITYERRYPFLYRPLVELTLQFPPQLKVHPHSRKFALREALRGVLPETVRTRQGKGGVGTRMLWSLNHEHRLIKEMLRDPILAQMGYIDRDSLRNAYEEARTGKQRLTVPLFSTLALETWLLIENGRWPRLEGALQLTSISTQKERTNHDTAQATLREAYDH